MEAAAAIATGLGGTTPGAALAPVPASATVPALMCHIQTGVAV